MPAAFPAHCCTAILVAAGASRRMGFDKLASPIGGKPVIRRALEALLAADSVSSVVVVCPEDRWRLLENVDFTKPVTRVDGGADRQDSVAHGLAAADPLSAFVAVHDAARPLVSPADIDRCVTAAMEHGAAALARRAADTMKRSDAEDFGVEDVSRENLWCMETPQVFGISLLRDACAVVAKRGLSVTDEVSAVRAIGARVKFVESRHPNLKITTPADIALAEALLEQKNHE